MSEILCKRLVEAREKAGYTRKALCEKLGIPYRTITNYENGSREPGSDYLVKVAKICGCTIDWLLGLQEKAARAPSYIPSQPSPSWKFKMDVLGDDDFDDLDLNYDDGNAPSNEISERPAVSPIRIFDLLASKYALSDDECVLVEKFVKLDAKKRAAVVEYVLDAAATMQSAPAVADDAEAAYIKSRLDSARNSEPSVSSTTEDTERNDEAANQ